MLSLALRGLASRKLRAVLTALAIMLGVAMVAGTFMLKGSVDKAFDDIFAEANAGVDVTVQPKSAFDSGFDLPESGAALPQSLVEKVAAVDGVEKASGGISDSTSIAILDENGDRIGPSGGGPPQIAQSVQPEPFNPFTWVEGSAPATDERGRDRLDHRRRGGLRGRPEDHDQRRSRRQGVHDCRDRAVRLRGPARRRQLRALHPPGGAGDHRQGGRARQDRRRGVRRGHAGRAVEPASTRICPRTSRQRPAPRMPPSSPPTSRTASAS